MLTSEGEKEGGLKSAYNKWEAYNPADRIHCNGLHCNTPGSTGSSTGYTAMGNTHTYTGSLLTNALSIIWRATTVQWGLKQMRGLFSASTLQAHEEAEAGTFVFLNCIWLPTVFLECNSSKWEAQAAPPPCKACLGHVYFQLPTHQTLYALCKIDAH